MIFRKGIVLFVAFGVAMSLSSCKVRGEPDGPYFGNGFHNGWANQTSIVIWTRLTLRPEGNLDGEPFLIPTKEEHVALDKNANAAEIQFVDQSVVGVIGGCQDLVKNTRLHLNAMVHTFLSLEDTYV